MRSAVRRAIGRRLRAIRPHPDADPASRRQRAFEAVAASAELATGQAALSRAELPLTFWEGVLGERLSAASGIWPRWAKDSHRAEIELFQVVAERAEVSAGQRVLEIGSTLGAFARWAEDELPGLEVTVAAATPRIHPLLESVISEHGPSSASLINPPLSETISGAPFDRILVLEAFADYSNPLPALRRWLSWLAPGGRLFWQTTCHWRSSYFMDRNDESRWLFDTPSGALLPGEDLLGQLEDGAPVLDRWELSGEHVERTARAWRSRLHENRATLEAVLREAGDPTPRRSVGGVEGALLGQEALFGFREGQEWALTQLLIGAP